MAKVVRYCPIVGCEAIATDRHHIGGAGSPVVWMCRNCHGRLHGVSWDSDHSVITRSGLVKARSEGRVGGNPGLRSGNPEAIRRVAEARRAAYLARLKESSVGWLPTVVEMRPRVSWGDVARVIGPGMSSERLRRSVRLLIDAGLADVALLDRASPTGARPSHESLIQTIKALSKGHTLQEIASRLEEMGLRAPRGGKRWHPSSVRNLLVKYASGDRRRLSGERVSAREVAS